MKFLIDANELKRVMKTVRKVFSLYSSREGINKACLLHGDVEGKTLVVEFALNDVFIQHTFIDIEFPGQQQNFKRSVDFLSLADLNFSEPLLELSIGSENKIYFKNGGLSGTLLVSNSDIEKFIEKSRPTVEWNYRYAFKLPLFIEAMEAHCYGKHTDSQALERPVRFLAFEDKNVFLSQDNIAACYLEKDTQISDADIIFYPGMMLQILKTLDKTPGVFSYDEAEQTWGLAYDRTRIWGPKYSARPPKLELLSIIKAVKESSGYCVKILALEFSKHLQSIKPFFDGSELKDKESAPFVTLSFKTGSQLQLQITNRRAFDVNKDVTVEYTGTFEEPQNISFILNYDFVIEFLASLTKNAKSKESLLEIIWWPYADEQYPTRGRAVAFSVDGNYYLVSRVSLKKGISL